MLILYAADMHGSEQVWRKFVNSANHFSAEVLILGGDVTGKIMVPVVEQRPGEYVAQVFGKLEKVRGEQELAALDKRLRFNGCYPYHCSVEEYQRVAADAVYRKQVMEQLMVETAARWARIADEKLEGTAVRIYGMAGNDDEQAIDDALRSEYLINVESQVVRMGPYQLLSCAWGNPSPWNTPRELPEDQLLEKFEGLAESLEPGVPTIFNLHIPPYKSGLDTGPEIAGVDANGQVVVKRSAGNPLQAPVGSTAVRTFIERHQPLLSLHSHIHESKNTTKIGRTLCLNPGSTYQDGVLDGALVTLDGDKVLRHQFVSG
jgi:Icc-related predicted phosphoesterase